MKNDFELALLGKFDGLGHRLTFMMRGIQADQVGDILARFAMDESRKGHNEPIRILLAAFTRLEHDSPGITTNRKIDLGNYKS
jgi:hypothetical protein